MLSTFFNELLYRPLFNALVFLYDTIAANDLGVAIVILTVLIRVVLFPLFHLSTKSQLVMQALRPEIEAIQKNKKLDKQEQARALMTFYKERNVNPFSGFFLLFLQLPILIALYQEINYDFFGLLNLNERSTLMVGLAALAQFLQGRLALFKHKEGQEVSAQDKLARQMVFLGPLLTLVILYRMPAAVGLYWATTALFSVGQQYLIKRSLGKNLSNHGKEPGTVGAVH